MLLVICCKSRKKLHKKSTILKKINDNLNNIKKTIKLQKTQWEKDKTKTTGKTKYTSTIIVEV